MRRFQWSLQRLLDVTVRKEEALRSGLVALTHQIVRIRQEIVVRKAMLRSVLAELARECIQTRIARQEPVMASSRLTQREIEHKQQDLDRCRRDKAARTEELLKVRASRETLQRLREEAQQRYLREQAALEQKQLDETAQVAFARNALNVRRQTPRQELGHD